MSTLYIYLFRNFSKLAILVKTLFNSQLFWFVQNTFVLVKVFRFIPNFRILRLTFHSPNKVLTHVLGAQKNSLTEMVLSSTLNICFGFEIRKRILSMPSYLEAWPWGYKTFFMLNSAEHKIYPAHKN